MLAIHVFRQRKTNGRGSFIHRGLILLRSLDDGNGMLMGGEAQISEHTNNQSIPIGLSNYQIFDFWKYTKKTFEEKYILE